jgi:hypothetical protein
VYFKSVASLTGFHSQQAARFSAMPHNRAKWTSLPSASFVFRESGDCLGTASDFISYIQQNYNISIDVSMEEVQGIAAENLIKA